MSYIFIMLLALLIFVPLIYYGSKKYKPIKLKSYNPKNIVFSDIDLDIFNKLNEYRKYNKLPLLIPEALCSSLCEEHNNIMIINNKAAHAIGDSTYAHRSSILLSMGVLKCGECIAYGYTKPDIIIKRLSESDKHRKIMLSDYTHVGLNYKNRYTTIFFIKVY